jgi:hypothetical protein
VLLRYALGLFNCGAVGFNELYQAMGKGIRFTHTAPDSAPTSNCFTRKAEGYPVWI